MGTVSITRRELADQEQCLALLTDLPSMPAAGRAAAVSVLLRSQLPGMRERTVAICSATINDDEIVSYLRAEADDMLRNAGLEILKRRGRKGLTLAVDLLNDRDPDIVLQAVLALDHHATPTALGPLRQVLSYPEPNVVQAAIVAIGRIGDERVIADLAPFLDGDPWLQLAAVNALGDLRSPAALNLLIPLMQQSPIGPVASEAVARIGGPVAFAALAELWMADLCEGDNSTVPLPLLAHVVEGLQIRPKELNGLRQELIGVLTSTNPEDRHAAAVCLLALGPGEGDLRSIGVLTLTEQESKGAPHCLLHRTDLIEYLVVLRGSPRSWAFLISRRNHTMMSNEILRYALREALPESTARIAVEFLERRADSELADVVLELFRKLPSHLRGSLATAVRMHRSTIESLLSASDGQNSLEELVLRAMIGKPASEIADDLRRLDFAQLSVVIPQLASRTDILIELPWPAWLGEHPESTCVLLATLIQLNRDSELLSVLHSSFNTYVHPSLIRILGDVGDASSVELLIGLLEHESPLVRTIAADTLGWIGGQRARTHLQSFAAKAPAHETEVALRALIRCVTTDDMAYFRQVASSAEAGQRKIAADALARDPSPENLSALVALAADPDLAVARQALDSMQAIEALS